MGCNTSSVVPLTESDFDDGIPGIEVRVNPSTPDVTRSSSGPPARKAALESSEPPEETLTRDFNLEERVTPHPPLAFEIPIAENGNGVARKHPPKRIRSRFEESGSESRELLTQEWIDGKQTEAEARRNELLAMRMQTGNLRRNRRLLHSRAFDQESEENDDDDDGRKA